MFENVLKELKRMERQSVSVPIESDEDGFFDKECPAEECLFGFKIYADDWKAIVRDEEVFCPSCRHAAPAEHWYPREQLERAKAYALQTVKRGIGEAMRKDATDWNRRQPRNSFISMTMSVKGSAHPAPLPLLATDPMRLRTRCSNCQCRYGYVGAAYFCPSCGRNSAEHTFQQTLTAIRTAVGNADKLRAAFDRDEAEVLIRTLLEKGVQDTVTSFQRLAERLYEQFPNAPEARRNAFQNLDAGSSLWQGVAGKAYGDLVAQEDLGDLRVGFQQRHLLAHQQGIVDQDYLDRSGDRTYALGQRIVLKEQSVLRFVDLVEQLAGEMLKASPAVPTL